MEAHDALQNASDSERPSVLRVYRVRVEIVQVTTEKIQRTLTMAKDTLQHTDEMMGECEDMEHDIMSRVEEILPVETSITKTGITIAMDPHAKAMAAAAAAKAEAVKLLSAAQKDISSTYDEHGSAIRRWALAEERLSMALDDDPDDEEAIANLRKEVKAASDQMEAAKKRHVDAWEALIDRHEQVQEAIGLEDETSNSKLEGAESQSDQMKQSLADHEDQSLSASLALAAAEEGVEKALNALNVANATGKPNDVEQEALSESQHVLRGARLASNEAEKALARARMMHEKAMGELEAALQERAWRSDTRRQESEKEIAEAVAAMQAAAQHRIDTVET